MKSGKVQKEMGNFLDTMKTQEKPWASLGLSGLLSFQLPYIYGKYTEKNYVSMC